MAGHEDKRMKRKKKVKHHSSLKVKDLIKELQEIDGELKVYISRDAEGNGYSPAHKNLVVRGYYDSGDFISEDNFEEDGEYFGIDDIEINCIVIYPE